NGGYFPVSWGWSAPLGLSVTTVALLAGCDLRPSSRELAFVASLAALLGWKCLSTAWSAGPTQAGLEGQRDLVYLGGVAAVVLTRRRLSAAPLAGGGSGAATPLVP